MSEENALGLDIPKIPVGKWFEVAINWLVENLQSVTKAISAAVDSMVGGLSDALNTPPPLVMVPLLAFVVYYISRKKSLGIFSFIAMALVANLGFWEDTVRTLTMVLVATLICMVIGLPLGVLAALNKTAHKIIMPILDFMQTMPAFVYLIPAVAFFNLGLTGGIFATVVFAVPPAIRLTDLGIRQVPEDLVECADAFGSTWDQKLIKLQLPIAMTSILAGINQTVMLALSMVVIAALVGAGGVGEQVWYGVSTLNKGQAFEAGLCIVILAIVLDRTMQAAGGRGGPAKQH